MKILYFYPENPLTTNQGNHSRALSLLQYFRDRKIEIDFIGESDFITQDNIAELKKQNLITNCYLIKRLSKSKNQLSYFFNYSLRNKILGKIKRFNNVKLGQQKDFNTILKQNSYDYIIISYTCWAELVLNNKFVKNAKLVIDTHDFLTSQFQIVKNFKLGKFFETEIKLLNIFDIIIAISIEEAYIYSQFTNKKVAVISHSLESNFKINSQEKNIDIIYVASDNHHNISAIKWFFDSVYPLLNESIKICAIGKIVNFIPDYKNVTKIVYAEDLSNYYKNSKIAICPMLSGTGLKIKVIEAMSFGLPIVCNIRGIDGLNNKTNNGCLVTNNPNEFANNISKLLEVESYYDKISNESKDYFVENNSLNIVFKKLDAIFT